MGVCDEYKSIDLSGQVECITTQCNFVSGHYTTWE